MDPSLPYWDTVAPRWDAFQNNAESFVNYQESFRRFHWFLKRSLKIGNRTKSYRLLDLGCGTGEASWPLWKRVSSVTFLDRSASMLRQARNKHPKGIFVRGEAVALPFLDAEFDVIISRGAILSQLEYQDIPNALVHIWRVLRPGGLFFFDIVTDPGMLPAPAGLYRSGLTRSALEHQLETCLPEATIAAYDGTEAHAFNRVLVKKR